jgi:peptide/nickel transport system substrate-binding protein
MKKIKPLATIALGVALSTGLAACGGGSAKNTPSGSGGAGYNAAIQNVVNLSNTKGGTLRLGDSDTFDSPDPGNSYYAWVMNFNRFYSRSLTTFQPAAGDNSLKIVPDLAESLGTSPDGGKTWTFKLRQGVKFEDGTPVTSKDVKYAVERSNFSDELQLGPKYFKAYLADNKPSYKGPYKDKSPEGLKSIETPDDSTITFHLNQPFADFNYLVQMSQTAPVQQSKDKGLQYANAIQSTGPYKIESYQPDKSMNLVRNPQWDASTDPIRKALPDRIELALKQDADDIDNRLMSGALDMDITGVGVQSGTQPKILGSAALKKQADNPIQGFLRFMSIDVHVKPLDNVHCRMAVQYATDKVAAQTAYGGPIAGGDIATTVIPPTVNGYRKFDLYPQTYASSGGVDDATLAKAKQELQACGQPNGFSTKLTARSDRPKEVKMAEAIQQGLAKAGIKAAIKTFPAGDYFNKYVGAPKYVHDNGIGLMIMAWAADWPTGYGFLDQIVDGAAIKPSGGNNLAEEDNPAVNSALKSAIGNTDDAARTKAWGDIDEMVMKDAVEVPLIYAKAILYRPANVKNVGVTFGYGGMYDYLNMGVK